jgi:hypothetical protein
MLTYFEIEILRDRNKLLVTNCRFSNVKFKFQYIVVNVLIVLFHTSIKISIQKNNENKVYDRSVRYSLI